MTATISPAEQACLRALMLERDRLTATHWRLDETGEWVPCGPYEPPRESLVIDSAKAAARYEIGALRSAAFSAIPSAMDRGKRAAKDRASGQTSMLDLLGVK